LAAGGDLPEIGDMGSPQTQELIATFHTIERLKQTYPAQSIRQYIISGAESEADVLNVVQLAQACGVTLAGSENDPGLMRCRCLSRLNRCTRLAM